MIQYFKVAGQELVPASSLAEAFWVHFDAPDAEEIDSAVARYGLPQDFFTDLQDVDKPSRLEVKGAARLIILRVPLYSSHKADGASFSSVPLGIIVIPNQLITVSFYDKEILAQLLEGKHRPFNITQQSFTLTIALRISIYYLKYLKEINRRTQNIENELHESMRNKELIRMLNMDKALVYFDTALKSNQLTLESMQSSSWLQADPDSADLIEDVIINNKQGIEMADISSNILSGMMDALASIISNNLNVVMKFLTSVTIILAVPTLIASIYGMNVRLPLQGHPYAFWGFMGISVGLSLILVFIFIRKKYF
ncbi:MAG: magnesium transporter CorA family protein [Candidatus Cloacimonetes bacterium]|nr:magnesium transporter CorA family protein [Candidatus Cloacimonadota bacterium]MDD2424009.1 magnesium transporter CorA family protein [Candidatus Cloacimonadota bacterium]MDD3562535.1 magnesium transporter CorA family protein [Candidatus Cloacimonadota bacterium]